MITLRLFETAKPFQQIAAHDLVDGRTVIGRDPSADWTIEDAFGDLSRKHCVVRHDNGRIFLADTSSNGVLVGPDKTPAPTGEEIEIRPGQTIYLGQYAILFDGASEADPLSATRQKPRIAARPTPTDAALLEHFCIGARLEPSSFAGEDPAELLARLGAVYRQVVDDLCDLMRDRAMIKDQLQMDRTTISARDNNPLKWAPPHRIAVELLQEGDTSFLKGSEAFRASFADLRRHGSGLAEGSRAAIDYVLGELDPDRLEEQSKPQGLAFVSRNELAWRRYRQLHADLSLDAADDGGKISGAMRAGYEASLDAHAQDDAA